MIFSLPNLLTLSRIVIVPVLVVLMWDDGRIRAILAFTLFTITGMTDYLDGYLARSQGRVSKLGMFLDPVADKIMVAAVIVMLVFKGTLVGYHVLAGIVILLREIIVSGLREFLAGIRVSVPVSQLAKWKTAAQMIALGALILHGAGFASLPALEVGLVTLWCAAILTLITGYDYLRAGLPHINE